MSSLALQDRMENLLDRYRGGTGSPSREELNDVYTDGCAAVLRLEAEWMRVKRRMTAALLDAANDPQEPREAADLAWRQEELVTQLAELRELVSQMRAALDSAQDEQPATPPRRRFRRR